MLIKISGVIELFGMNGTRGAGTRDGDGEGDGEGDGCLLGSPPTPFKGHPAVKTSIS